MEKPENRKHRWTFWVTVMLLITVLYAASYGPAFLFMMNEWMPESVFRFLYRPLFVVFEYCPKSWNHAIYVYLDWWLNLVPDRPKPAP